MEVLYTITNKVGASTGQYSHYKEDLYSYAQEAFGISSELHRKFMAIASEEKVSLITAARLNVVWNPTKPKPTLHEKFPILKICVEV